MKKIAKLIFFLVVLIIVGTSILLVPVFKAIIRPKCINPTKPPTEVIRCALRNYRYEYGNWPVDSTQTIVRIDTSATLADFLSSKKTNPKDIRFLNTNEFEENLSDPWGRPYHILIDQENDTCKVWADPPPNERKGCGCN